MRKLRVKNDLTAQSVIYIYCRIALNEYLKSQLNRRY